MWLVARGVVQGHVFPRHEEEDGGDVAAIGDGADAPSFFERCGIGVRSERLDGRNVGEGQEGHDGVLKLDRDENGAGCCHTILKGWLASRSFVGRLRSLSMLHIRSVDEGECSGQSKGGSWGR